MLGQGTPNRGRVGLGDIEVSYRVQGEGPTVVLVHGLAQDLGSWSAQQDGLGSCRTLAYDLRGHGASTLGRADGTLEQLAGDLIGLLEMAGPATCVGFSLGGTIVLRAASLRPDLIERAVVLGTSSVVGRTAAEFYEGRIDLMRSGSADAIARGMREDTASAVANPDVDVDALSRARVTAIGDGGGYCNAAAAMAALRANPLTEHLTAIESPVLVVGGEHDSFCPRKAADIMLAVLPTAEYRELPGVAHLMGDDDPHAVTELLRDFLSIDRAGAE